MFLIYSISNSYKIVNFMSRLEQMNHRFPDRVQAFEDSPQAKTLFNCKITFTVGHVPVSKLKESL
jgi:hypothetical protein